MKTQKSISIKTGLAATLILSILTLSACNNGEGSSTKNENQAPIPEKQVKPPAMDIHTATVIGNLDAIKQHIQAGSDLDKKDDYGSTALITATVFGKTDVALALIDAGADVNLQNNDGSTPLYCAAFFCRTELVNRLLENGADRNIRNNFGSTPLESVAGPFSEVKGIYDLFSKDLGPVGLKLDYNRIEETRLIIAEILR